MNKYEISESQFILALEDYGFYHVDGDTYDNDNGHQIDIYREYSGRGMFGATCFGIVVNAIGASYLVFAALSHVLGQENLTELATSACEDSMGRDTIVYFPEFKIVD